MQRELGRKNILFLFANTFGHFNKLIKISVYSNPLHKLLTLALEFKKSSKNVENKL